MEETEVIWEVRDPAGRTVTLARDRWERILVKRNGALDGHEQAVMRAVVAPDLSGAGNVAGREVHCKRGVGPSNWMVAVVAYEGSAGRVITAYPSRKDPKVRFR